MLHLARKLFSKPTDSAWLLSPHPENETIPALREHNNNSVGMKEGDPFGKTELTIDTTDYCSSLKPKVMKPW